MSMWSWPPCRQRALAVEPGARGTAAGRLSLVLVFAVLAAAAMTLASCVKFLTAPSAPPLPLRLETATHRYYCAGGDTIDTAWQEVYHAWATGRLGVVLPQKISYYKYVSRQEMGLRTGQYHTNGFAEPDKYALHTLWPTDNHEVVHIYTARIGRPGDFFNEGLAVAFQVDPVKGRYESRFNGEEVHAAARRYLDEGRLVLPLTRIVQTSDFRAISDSVLAYREAGSFVRFLIDSYGLDRALAFFRASRFDDSTPVVLDRFAATLGVAFTEAEDAWLAMLRSLFTGGAARAKPQSS